MLRRKGWLPMGVMALIAVASAGWLPRPLEAQVTGEHASTPLPTALQQRAAQWEMLSALQRRQWQQRSVAWEALPRPQREGRRARYAAWLALDEVQRARLRAAATEVSALPLDQQQALRTQFAQLDEMQRRGWRLGPALGADFSRLQPLFGFVPAAEREASLSLLQQLDASQRDDLAALAQRIPPQERAAFRNALLQVPVAQRGPWLQQQRAR